MSPQSAKICVVCGEDCSHSPRVKDPRGRYYCKPCYESARQGGKEHSRRHDDEDERTTSSNWGGSLLDDLDAEESSAASGKCPECDAALEPGAVLCVNCGYILKAGKHIKSEIITDEGADPAEADEPRSKWPIVVGIFSLIFAVFGVLVYGAGSFMALKSSPAEAGGPLVWALGIVLQPILLVLSIGLGAVATMLMKRRAAGAVWLWRWSWAKAIASLAYGAFVAMQISSATDLPDEVRSVVAIGTAIIVPLVLLWMLFWPVFLLPWLRRTRVREEVAQWT